MIQLRLFVHQRMYAAAEDILGQVENMLALSEAEDARLEQNLRHQLSSPTEKTGFLLNTSTTNHGDEGDISVLQENQDLRSTELSNLCPDPEVSRLSQSPADLASDTWSFPATDFKMVEIKEEEEDLVDVNQTRETGFMESEEDQHQPININPFSFSSGATLGESKDEEELMNNNTGGNNTENNKAESQPVEEEKERNFCRLCGKSYLNSTSLKNHMKTHEGVRDCGFCGLKHQTANKLIKHLKQFHRKSHFCDVCGRTYTAKRRLNRHMKTHTGNRDFVCRECGKAFYRKEHLVVHVRTHSGEKPYRCEICGKAFSQSQNVAIHKRSHTGEKPYHCRLCGRLCVTSSALSQHLRYHTGEKPFSCDVCGKKFYNGAHVRRHMITHTGEKPHACTVCGKTFSLRCNLKVHMKNH
ncbi:zinc finger protein OZF [Austrofundulus limnaeus]|uniref:Zinc finger protein OZF n=1 Tax=Austrofundulus limnaeus TaxID=52670 RepID=A0A2I4BRJ1_AUSLI|nr:PREDICTED: zinc finger protein OZF-like [Austrofundulus limnaeus]